MAFTPFLSQMLLQILVVVTVLRGLHLAGAHEPLGLGYRITSVNELRDGDGIVAQLELIVGCETYGPDIKELRLTARYQEGGRIHVHITDANQQRWEVPQSLIPRRGVDNLQIVSKTTTDFVTGKEYGLLKEGISAATHPLKITYTVEPFGFKITRKSTGEILFNSAPDVVESEEGTRSSSFRSLVFKDQYLEISSRLPQKSYLYGLGEATRPDGICLTQGRTYTIWATDIGSHFVDIPLYSSYPFILDMRKGGNAHAVLFLNSNGMDIRYEKDFITFKAIGGVFDFYFFAGPSPLAVIDQYTQLVGRPASMPYWALGFHQSRYGYKNVEELQDVLEKYEAAKFPVESMWSDIDHMDGFKDFTLHPVHYPEEKLRPFVDALHKNNQKFIMILDPGIKIDETYKTYTRGDALDIYMKNGTGESRYIAQVWPGATNMPDFFHPNAQQWWSQEVADFHQLIPFDGLWLDMNEPANFCSGPNCYYDPNRKCPEAIYECCMICNNDEGLSRWDDPPYKINSFGTKQPLYKSTVAMNALHYNGIRMYDTHNIYGMSEGLATYNALKELNNKRPFVLARSCFVGSGAHAARWTGDNGATWSELGNSVVSLLSSGLFGVPFIGADICGFNMDTTEELCRRWAQLGAFYPLARSHSDIYASRQEFYLWNSVIEAASHVFYWRYRLLPFFYTLMYEAHTTGAPLARPLFFEYPEDEETWSIGSQFLLGHSLLVSPVLKEGATSVKAYIPKGIWYNLFDTSRMIGSAEHGVYEELPAPHNTINVHVRQGSVIPMQDFAMTTTLARQTPFSLLIAFAPTSEFPQFCVAPNSIECQGSDREYASGHLFIDDDDQIDMVVTPGQATYIQLEATKIEGHYTVRSSVTEGEYATRLGLKVHAISVLGVRSPPGSVQVNGRLSTSMRVSLNVTTSLMELSGLNLAVGEGFEVTWKTMRATPEWTS